MKIDLTKSARIEGHAAMLRMVESFIPYTGRRVYEIGTDRNFRTAILLADIGAKEVVCTNLVPADTSKIAGYPNITFTQIDGGRTPFADGSFDVVHGQAILEHIHEPEAIAAETARLLKPGGRFFLNGGPMWTSVHGHHVWVDASSGAHYHFPNRDTFEPWEHLMFPPEAILGRLVARGVPTQDAREIIAHVYHSNDQNRIAPTRIIEAFEAESSLETAVIREAVGGEPPVIAGISPEDLNTGGLHLIGRKLGHGEERGPFQAYVAAGMQMLNMRQVAPATK